MRVAVTGASGLLGRAIVDALSTSHDVIRMSRRLTGDAGPAAAWTLEHDWRDTARLCAGVDVIVHSAAHIPRRHSDPDEARRCLEANGVGTLNLLRAAEDTGVKRFIYISGANVLRVQDRPVREDDPIGCERAPFYLGSKVVGEIFVRSFQDRGLSCLTLRPSSIYGPSMAGGVITTFAEQLRAGSPIRLADGGQFQADYVWRADVAGIVAAAVESRRVGEVNLGSGHAAKLTEVASILAEVVGADPSLIVVEPRESTSALVGFSAVDNTRAREWFDFHPTALSDGLSRLFGERRP